MKPILLLLLLTLAGCTRATMPAVSPAVETHTEHRNHTRRDSIFVRDSVRVVVAKDTVWVTRERWHYTNRYVRDTVWRRDSIPYPVEVVREVRHIPTLYRYSLWLALASLAWILWRLFRR